MAKLDGLKEHVDQALDVACQQLTRVVHLEKLEWQQLSLSQQRSEAAAAAEGLKRLRNIFRARFDENLSFEAKEYADEANAILNDLFGNLDHYLQYDPSLEQEKLKQLGGRLCGEPGPLLTTQWIINGSISSPNECYLVQGSFSDWLLYHVVPSLSQIYGAKGVHKWLAKAQ